MLFRSADADRIRDAARDAHIHDRIVRLPDGYDTVLLGSPIWNVRAPMIMTTFTEQLDFTGKTVVPFTTHAMSGLGTTVPDSITAASRP